MIDKEYLKRVIYIGITLLLLVLLFFLLKPILLSIIMALILSFLFYPVYLKITKVLKSKNLSAFLICIILMILIITPIWFFTPILIKQSFQIYTASQQMDLVTPLKAIFPDLFASEAFSQEIGSALHSFITKLTNSIMNLFADLIRNFPILFLQFLVVFFVFFFALKDQEKLLNYIKSILPFSKEVENKLFKSSRGITVSVIYGQIVLGIAQGLLLGIALFLFKVPNALFLTILACLAGIFPIIGTTIIWVPIVIYLLIVGDFLPAIGVLVFGVLASCVDNFVKPVIISKRTNIHPALILIGMVGGLLLFGVIGVILGPLILAYLFIILEIYRDKRVPGIFIQPSQHIKSLK